MQTDSGQASKDPKRYLEDEVRFTGKYSQNVTRTIVETFRPYLKMTWTSLFIGIIARLCLLSTANISGYWADSLCQNDSFCHALPSFFDGYQTIDFLYLLITVVSIGFICNLIFRVSISRTGAKAVSTLYDEVTMHVSRFPMDFFDKTPVGRIMSRFSSDYASIFRMAGGPLGEFLGLAFDLIATLILMSLASIYYVPIVLLACAAYYFLYRHHIPAMRTNRRNYAATRSPSVAHFAETVQGARLIKVYGKTGTFLERFEKQLNTFARARLALAFSSQHYSFHMAIVTSVLLLITGLAGIFLVSSGRVSAGSLATAFTFILVVSTTIQQFFEWLANFEEALTGVERFDNYLRRPLELGSSLPLHAQYTKGVRRRKNRYAVPVPSDSAATVMATAGAEVKIENIWLRYGPDLPWVLKDLNLTIRPGERLAIVGRTGSGKSSLIQTLFLMYPPEKGRIVIDGKSPDLSAPEQTKDVQQGMDLEAFRRGIGLIPQDPTLFRGTLRENLIASDDKGYDPMIWDILQTIDLDSWVHDLGNGQALDYQIEERGGNLSAGERQLICMARCFLSKAPLIITDEATSAIDPASEELLVKALEQRTKGRTVIIVAHRLSTVKTCDRVLWLDQGAVRMLDTPEIVLPLFSSTALAD
jgi:ABC-type multidrug transport system fused ATPase/permease subunit